MDLSDNQTISECMRCGTCCKKGGPALHDDDKHTIDSGKIPLTTLYTIRKGELASDNVNGGLIRLAEEIIKIKSRPDSTVCIYYNDAESSCSIYEHRPLECRVLECWNTEKIAAIYAELRLNRRSVLEKISWLTELVETHEDECSLEKLQALTDAREAGDAGAASELMHLINYDRHLRQLVVEKGGILPEMIDFLFGRSLADIIPAQFGIKISKAEGRS